MSLFENIQIMGFLSGIGGSFVGILATNILVREREKKIFLKERRFKIYMKLMDLYTSYHWFTVAEIHKKTVRPETKQRCFSLSWQIADLLRSADEVDLSEDILNVTLGSDFPTTVARHDAMEKIIDRLGKKVNPRYAKNGRRYQIRGRKGTVV